MAEGTGSAKREHAKFSSFGKILKSIFCSLGSALELIGRPIFYFLLYTLYAVRYALVFLGYLTLLLIKLLSSILQTIGKLLLKIRLPRIKILFPRIRVKRVVVFSLLILFFFLATASFFYFSILKDLPDPNKLITRDQIVSTKIYDRRGQLLYKIYRNQNRTLVKLWDIPLSLRQATIAIEDSQFYTHPGFTLRGIIRAAYNTLFKGKLQGGSTITQQLVKSALLSPERTLTRKIKELILSIQVESYFSKDEILQMYFNEVGYGGAAYGAEEATQLYFGKSVKDLNLAESALLAGLSKSPTRYSPFGAYPHFSKKRQAGVLRRMTEEGYITEAQAEQARRAPLIFAPQKTDIQAPHFVMYVKELLVQKYGEKMVEEGGLEVITTLDLKAQEMTEKIVAEEIARLKDLSINNGAALVTNPRTGEILAMVGSKDYFNLEEDGNVNVTIMSRQPGSAIKVINYAYALSHGYTPATILSDSPVTYKVPGQPPYSPKNYDGQFHGNIPLRVAFASSYNVPAVKVLASYGVDKMIDEGEKMGITTWGERSRFGLSLTLGGGEVKMVDMVVVYGTLANLGRRVDLNPILEVKDYKGEVLKNNSPIYQFTSSPIVLNPHVAYLLTDILSDNWARTPAFGASSLLIIPNHQVAVKTGTTQNLRDNWTLGYTPSYLVAVWVGNNDNQPMSYVASGVTGATPIWQQIMKNLLQDKENESFLKPEDLIKVEICSLNGLLPCQGCPTRTEYFLPGTEPKVHCDPEKMKKPKETPQDKILEGVSTER